MSPKPKVRAWSDGYLGQDHRGQWKPNPAHYPAGSPQNPIKKGSRARAATAAARARIRREQHEPLFGGCLGEVTEHDEEMVHKLDEAAVAEFFDEDEA